jgi:hypothetical protein
MTYQSHVVVVVPEVCAKLAVIRLWAVIKVARTVFEERKYMVVVKSRLLKLGDAFILASKTSLSPRMYSGNIWSIWYRHAHRLLTFTQ